MKQGVQYVLHKRKYYRIIYVCSAKNYFKKEKVMNTTKSHALLEALQNGEQLTAKQITHRFGIANPTASVSALRFDGYAIYANTRKAGNGVNVTEYRHGEASRKMVAAAYKAMAMGLV